MKRQTLERFETGLLSIMRDLLTFRVDEKVSRQFLKPGISFLKMYNFTPKYLLNKNNQCFFFNSELWSCAFTLISRSIPEAIRTCS